ncbi:MAG: hypothetical protein JNN25_00675 [Candidatus Kapabacteria bacterium]|nr:hypothetical protein [Candidatus Kapabacteria bacterium]
MDSSHYRSSTNNPSDTSSSQQSSGSQRQNAPSGQTSSAQKTLKLRVSGSHRLVCCTQWNFGSVGTREE